MMEKREIIFENIVENISDGILTIGLDGRILLANASATSILGIEKDRLVGQKLAKLLMRGGLRFLSVPYGRGVLEANHCADGSFFQRGRGKVASRRKLLSDQWQEACRADCHLQ